MCTISQKVIDLIYFLCTITVELTFGKSYLHSCVCLLPRLVVCVSRVALCTISQKVMEPVFLSKIIVELAFAEFYLHSCV